MNYAISHIDDLKVGIIRIIGEFCMAPTPQWSAVPNLRFRWMYGVRSTKFLAEVSIHDSIRESIGVIASRISPFAVFKYPRRSPFLQAFHDGATQGNLCAMQERSAIRPGNLCHGRISHRRRDSRHHAGNGGWWSRYINRTWL